MSRVSIQNKFDKNINWKNDHDDKIYWEKKFEWFLIIIEKWVIFIRVEKKLNIKTMYKYQSIINN